MYRKVPVSVTEPCCGAAVRSMMFRSGRVPGLKYSVFCVYVRATLRSVQTATQPFCGFTVIG